MLRTELEAHKKAPAEFWSGVWQSGLVRYISAGVAIWVAIWLLHQDGGKEWWLSVALFIYALIRAREASLFVLGLGGLYLIIRGVAILPVSVAVIIGAFIIAAAVKK